MAKENKSESTNEEKPAQELAAATVQPTSAPAKASGHVVAPGLSVTSLRGLLDAGEQVTERDFPPGSFADLVSRGAIVAK